MAYINVDEVYILDNTGLQVDMATDIPFADAGFTDAQKEQARKNIAAGGTNPNLLDNPFFNINQRGITTMSSASYAMDRWKCDNAVTNGMVYSNGVLTLSSTTVFAQRLEQSLFDAIKGRTVTASGILSDNTIKSATAVVNSSGTTTFSGVASIDTSPLRFRMGNIAIKAVKLELGSVSTIANDTPPDYGTELAKCRYRYVPISLNQYSSLGWGFMTSGTSAEITIPLSSPFALDGNTPTISITNSGNLKVGDAAGTNAVTPTSWTIRNRTATTITIEFTIPAGYFSANTGVYLRSVGEAIIAISADL